MNSHKNLVLAIAAVAILGAADVATANSISYEFTGLLDSGPAAGLSFSGDFTYDSTIVPVGGGTVTGANLLTDLNFNWVVGPPYDETTANTGQLNFNPDGSLFSAIFGPKCVFGAGCTGAVSYWFVNGSSFIYSVPNGAVYSNSNVVTLRGPLDDPVQLPEPASLALVAIGLGGLGVAKRRKRTWCSPV